MHFTEVDPTKFIDTSQGLPVHGRGAWTRAGISDDYRYHLRKGVRVGDEAELSLSHWAVSAAVGAIQARLVVLGLMSERKPESVGHYGKGTFEAVKEFQAVSHDPFNGNRPLSVDGIVGRSDSFALFTPLIDAAAFAYKIPDRYLRGEINHESLMDPGAVGYYIYYAGLDGQMRYGGVDRGLTQNNNKANPDTSWVKAFDADKAIVWAAARMRTYYDLFTKNYDRGVEMTWDATLCSHNSPARAHAWLKNGYPSPEAAKYVNAVKTARY